MKTMCEVQLKVRQTDKDLILMLSVDETIDQLAMVNSVRWYGHALRKEGGHVQKREDGHVLKKDVRF